MTLTKEDRRPAARLPLFGGIEAGGTKFVCAVGTGPGEGLLARTELPTGSDSVRQLRQVVEWLKEQQGNFGHMQAIGVATFGPVDLHRDSASFGRITSTPKPGWANSDLLGPLRAAFPGIPLSIDTDVNGAALGEHRWGAARGLTDFVYITMGTGIGGGGMSGGKLLHGLVHPEIGHMRLPRLPGDDFAGVCPYHGDCWEGLCCGPAIEARTRCAAQHLSPDHDVWRIQTHYVAAALANIAYVLSPQRIILGGSVSKAGQLGGDSFLQLVRGNLQQTMAGYIQSAALSENGISEYVVPPSLGENAGICGAFALAQSSYKTPRHAGKAN